jgi:hypothetical protein
MYRTFHTAKEYKYCSTAFLWVSYDSDNNKKIFLYAEIAGSSYSRNGVCLLRGTD